MATKRSRGAGTTKLNSAAGADTSTPTNSGVQSSLYVQIADRAYYIWLEKGKPDVGAMDFWFQAEAQVLREQKHRFSRRQA